MAILDGNVKRVLTRFLGFGADLAVMASERQLWDAATKLLPVTDLQTAMPRYTQGMMDLGATVCSTKKPRCDQCPLATSCVARAEGLPERYPVKTRKLKRSAQSIWMLWAQTCDQAVWLSKRPTPGVWAGLYCFPLFEDRAALESSLSADHRLRLSDEPSFVHVLTHKDLHLHPVRVELPLDCVVQPSDRGSWLAKGDWSGLGLPAPIRKLLLQA